MINIPKAKRALIASFESAIEEAKDTSEQEEIEYEIYGRYVNLNDIVSKSNGLEFQEQNNIQQENGSLRVRYVKQEDEEAFIMTSKRYDGPETDLGVPEVNIPVNEGMFQHFKAMAKNGMIKNRYFVPIGHQKLNSGEKVDIQWEVDVFLDGKGEPTGWVKIDLPVLEELKELPELPFELEDKFILPLKFSDRSPEDKAKVRKIIDSVTVKGAEVSLESGDMMAYKRTEQNLEDGEFVTGMEMEFESDRYTDKGPCDAIYIGNDKDEFEFQIGDDEFKATIDLADVTLHKSKDGKNFIMVS